MRRCKIDRDEAIVKRAILANEVGEDDRSQYGHQGISNAEGDQEGVDPGAPFSGFQWQEEMLSKFDLDFVTTDQGGSRHHPGAE